MTTRMTAERNAHFREVLMTTFDLGLIDAVRMTRRQEQVVRTWLASGSYEEAGRRLGVTGQAVMMHVQRIALRAERVLSSLDRPPGPTSKAA